MPERKSGRKNSRVGVEKFLTQEGTEKETSEGIQEKKSHGERGKVGLLGVDETKYSYETNDLGIKRKQWEKKASEQDGEGSEPSIKRKNQKGESFKRGKAPLVGGTTHHLCWFRILIGKVTSTGLVGGEVKEASMWQV